MAAASGRPIETRLFINNEFVPSISGKTFPTLNPATGETMAEIQEADAADVDVAVAAAKAAFARGSAWRTMDASGRGRLLNKLADAIERDREYLARLDSMDNGKPYSDALNIDLALVVKCFRYYAGWTDKIHGKTIPIDGNFLSITRHEALGVCGMIVPWNFPLLMATWKLAPALCCGCVCVLKSAEQTPMSVLHLASLIKEVGFPAGVVNILSGFGPTCGAAIVAHKDVDKIAFTGSTEVGKIIMASAAPTLKNVTLELGGKSPAIVFADADLDQAAAALNFGLFFNGGQVCCASSRIYCHESVYEEFVAKVHEHAKKIVVGNGLDAGTTQGPQVDQPSIDKIERMVNGGKAEGARLVCGGSRTGSSKGLFYAPTIFADVTDTMEIAREEIFGPVMSVLKFSTTEEVLQRANDNPYGLAAACFTTKLDNALTASMALRAGVVWVNTYDILEASTPFGGYKQSGVGRELGEYGLQQYSEIKSIIIAIQQKNS